MNQLMLRMCFENNTEAAEHINFPFKVSLILFSYSFYKKKFLQKKKPEIIIEFKCNCLKVCLYLVIAHQYIIKGYWKWEKNYNALWNNDLMKRIIMKSLNYQFIYSIQWKKINITLCIFKQIFIILYRLNKIYYLCEMIMKEKDKYRFSIIYYYYIPMNFL